jgi:hypothetical protein
MNMFGSDAYAPLLGAVEEHIDSLRPGATPGQPTPKYDALKEYVAPYDTNGRMMAALDKWKSDNRTLGEALEHMPPLQAPTDGFRTLATSRESGANSNQVLASATRGAANLATYANALTDNVTQKFDPSADNMSAEDRLARRTRYMNDAPANASLDKNNDYEMATLATTGPQALVYLYKTKALGVAEDDPSIQMPHTHSGHLSLAEKDHTWLTADHSPQRDDDSPSLGGPSDLTKNARQRFPRPSSKDLSGGSKTQNQGTSLARPPSR